MGEKRSLLPKERPLSLGTSSLWRLISWLLCVGGDKDDNFSHLAVYSIAE